VLGWNGTVKGVVHFFGHFRFEEFLPALSTNTSRDIPKNEMLPTPAVIPFDHFFRDGSAAVIAIRIFAFHKSPR